MIRAESTDWKNKPLTSKCTTVSIDRTFTEDEMKKITMGYIPEEMENKWFIFWEDGILYFHRSWTGIGMYEVRFKKDGDAYEMYEADINRNPEEYKVADDEEDIKSINFLIDRLLLNRHADLPENNDIESIMRNWSFFGSATLENDDK